MGNYKRTIISEDGSKIEMTDPSLKDNITIYTFNDESEKRGFFSLNESDKVIADNFLIVLKLAYISYEDTLDNTSKDEIYNETIQQVNELTDDTNTRKYLKKRIDVLFQTSITFDDIKKDLDNYSTDEVIIIIKEYITETAEDRKEKTTEIKKWLVEYLAKRKAEEQPTETIENEVVEEEKSFAEKHPLLTGFGRFAKNVGLTLVGEALQMSDKEIETLKQSDVGGVIETLYYTAESHKDDIAELKKKKAFEERGMDYDLYQSMSSFEKSKYLNAHTNSKEERALFERGIQELDEEYSVEEYDYMYYEEEMPSYLETEEEN